MNMTLKESPPKLQEEVYEGLPIYKSIEINHQRGQIALALMSPLEGHCKIEW